MSLSALSLWVAMAPLLAGLAYCAWHARRAHSLRVGLAALLLVALGLAQLLAAPAVPEGLADLLLGGHLLSLTLRFSGHALAALVAVALVRSLRERNRAEEIQWESMEAVRELGAFFSRERGPFEARIDELLHLGCGKLRMEIGVVSRIQNERYEVTALRAPADFELARGDSLDLADTPCRDTIRAVGVLAFESLERKGRTERERARRTPFRYESYLGIALRIDRQPIGTLCFGSGQAHPNRFTGVEKQLLELMAHWIETELSRLRQDQGKRLAPRSDEFDRRRVDIDEAVRQLETELREALPGNDLCFEPGHLDCAARMYRHEFDRVLWSLVLHAASLCAEGRTLRLATAAVTPHVDAPSSKPFLTLAITAEGAELDASAQSKLFDSPADTRGGSRATTVSPSREGLLSLSRARRLLDDAGGDLSIHSEAGTGTTFTAWLPAVPVVSSDRSPAKDAGDGAVPGGR